MTINELVYLFYSNGTERNADYFRLNDIKYLLDEGFLHLTTEKLVPVKEYYACIDKIGTNEAPVSDFDGGGISHMALKYIAKAILTNSGETDIVIEKEYRGFRPDVMTKDGRTIIECGTVNPDKILGYFEPPEVTEKLIIIPYPYEGESHLMKYIFTPGEELGEFISFLLASRREKLKSLKHKQT